MISFKRLILILALALPVFAHAKAPRRPVFLFKVDDSNTHIYVDTPAAPLSYETFKVYVGPIGGMKEIEITWAFHLRKASISSFKLENGSGIHYSVLGRKNEKPSYLDPDGAVHSLTDMTANVKELSPEDIQTMIGSSSLPEIPSKLNPLKDTIENLRKAQ